MIFNTIDEAKEYVILSTNNARTIESDLLPVDKYTVMLKIPPSTLGTTANFSFSLISDLRTSWLVPYVPRADIIDGICRK